MHDFFKDRVDIVWVQDLLFKVFVKTLVTFNEALSYDSFMLAESASGSDTE